MQHPAFERLIHEYHKDSESVYHTWFLNNEDRLKAFRTIKSGLNDVIKSIENRTFGNDFKGSLLEVIVTAISEQKQIFEGQHMPSIGSLNFAFRIFTKAKSINWHLADSLKPVRKQRTKNKLLMKL